MTTTSRFITLGTAGGPVPKINRAQPSHVLVCGDNAILIDCGDGAIGQLMRAGIDFRTLDEILISHHHIDHVAGLYACIGANMMLMRKKPLRLRGPKGTERIAKALIDACKVTGETGLGLLGKNNPHPDEFLVVEDIEPGVQFDICDVKLSCCETTHYRSQDQFGADGAISLAYRFDAPDRSIVFTGDTGPCRAVEALADGVDLLVAEMMDIDGTMAMVRKRNPDMSPENIAMMGQHMAEHHLTPKELGRLAKRTGAKQVVAFHIPLDTITPDTAPAYLAQIATSYRGPATIAEDLQEF